MSVKVNYWKVDVCQGVTVPSPDRFVVKGLRWGGMPKSDDLFDHTVRRTKTTTAAGAGVGCHTYIYPVAPVAYQGILELDIVQFREFEVPPSAYVRENL